MSELQPTRAAALLGATSILVTSVLLLDERALVTQVALATATLLALLLMLRSSATSAAEVAVAIVIATAGECILSLWWGLYEYRIGFIPLYVPFGHGVFYLVAAESSRVTLLQSRAIALRNLVLIASGAWALYQLTRGDEWGFIWWVIAAAFIVRSSHPLLLSLCYVYTFALEIAGTANGNWRWASEVPGLGLGSANPPSGVGVLYCILDVCTLAVIAVMRRGTADGSSAVETRSARPALF